MNELRNEAEAASAEQIVAVADALKGEAIPEFLARQEALDEARDETFVQTDEIIN